ncbi:MAG: hypothetical protein ACI8RD_000386 [Bacillariaceae sp.]|jgi:hypothetical protein
MNTSKTHTIDSPLRLCHGNNLSEQQNKLKITMMSNNNVVVVGCENMITKNSPITGKNKNKKMDNGSLNKMNMKMKMKMNMMRSSRLSESESTLLINYSTTSMNSMNSACNMPSLSSNAFNIDDDDDDDDNNNNSNSTKCQQQTQKQHKRLLQMLQGRRKKEESTNVLVEKDDFTLLLQQLECTGDDDEEDEQQQEEDDEENTSLLLIPADPSSSDMINATIIKDCIDDTCSTADADTDNDTASFISTINDTDTKSNTIANSNAVICTTTTTSSSTKTRRKKQKHVHFGSLIIHEHPLVMGGAGLPSNGPSITLSWRQDTCLELPSVLLYEESRPCLPRKGIELLHPKNQRIDLLLGSGYTFREIKECEKECDIIRKQRIQTVKHIQQRSSFTKIGNKIRKKIFKQPRRTATTKGKVR